MNRILRYLGGLAAALPLFLAAARAADTASAPPAPMRYRMVAVEPNLWIDPRHSAQVAAEIDAIVAAGFNGISIGTFKFMPMYFVDYAGTKYPEAQQFDAATVARNVATLRANIRLAKSKGIQLFVSRSYQHYVGVNFWRAHQKELNPDGLFTRLLEEAHQNDIYFNTLKGKDVIIPQQQWTNPTFRQFFLDSTALMLDALPELDGFLNAYAEAAWTYDLAKLKENKWRGWKDAVDYPATDACFVDYANTIYRMLKAKRGDRLFFGMRDWYVSPQVLKGLELPRNQLVISVKYAGFDQPLVNYPPWGKALLDDGFSVILDLHEFDAEHPHPIYWYDPDIITTTFRNIRSGAFSGIMYQGFEGRGNEAADPIRLLTNRTLGAAMREQPFTEADAQAFLAPYYGAGSADLLRSLKAVSFAQTQLIKLCPAWFWQGDGLTPGGPQTLKFWMLMDNPDAPPGMAFVRQDVVGVKEFVAANLAGPEAFARALQAWKAAGKKTPEDVVREMGQAADEAVDAAVVAARRTPAKAPYLRDIVASAFIHREMVRRDVAFVRAAIAFYASGGRFDGKYTMGTGFSATGVDRKAECRAQLLEMIRRDEVLRELCLRYAPRRPKTRENTEYAFVRRVAQILGAPIEIPPLDQKEVDAVAADLKQAFSGAR